MQTKNCTIGGLTPSLLVCLILVIFVSPAFSAENSAKPWNGIIPCVSTRISVEKALGKSFTDGELLDSYRYRGHRVDVHYIRRNAQTPGNDIVQKIELEFEKPILLTKFIKRFKGFPKGFVKKEMDKEVSHVAYLAFYLNAFEGIDFTVHKDDEGKEIVTGASYFQPGRTCK